MRDEPRSVFFSKNTFIFSGRLYATVERLAIWEESDIQKTKEIYLGLSYEDVSEGLGIRGSQINQEWHKLVQAFRDRLRTSGMRLIVETAHLADDLACLEENTLYDYTWLHGVSLQVPLCLRHLKRKGLRQLHVSLSWSAEIESMIEKDIMSPNYDSEAEDKLDWRDGGYGPLILLQVRSIEALFEFFESQSVAVYRGGLPLAKY